ncbi:protein FAM228A isoform X1 [Larimichthys crocea]|uniref:protein FAM228A isoform X1 n=1 Tax=Larimichthys crocea TaxID=215358 RepID=UPI000622FB97|nr:protein FAM228B isoform X1 [Larimichthys crocea]
MSPKRKNTSSGVITFHTPVPLSLLKSEEFRADMKDTSESRKSPSQLSARRRTGSKCIRAEKRDEASRSGTQPGSRQHQLSHTSLRRLQAKMEAENQQAKEIIQPLLDAENGFVKELERFLSQRDVAELRRRELQHKRWTERVWFPLQRKVEEHVSSCSPVEAKRRQSLYSHYLHHCNTKGFVFLETYNPKEYNPFLLNIKQPHYFKLSTADSKEPLYRQLHERPKQKTTAHSCEAGCKYELLQSNRPLSESVSSQADTLLLASSNYVSASGKTPVKNKTEGRKSSRLDTIPLHIRATATPDGRCHQAGCFFSRCEGRQQPTGLHQSLPPSK